MKDFSEFEQSIRGDTTNRNYIATRLHREIATIPAASMLGAVTVQKIISTVSDVSIDICLSMMKAYHVWLSENEIQK
jgi:hypothetical protein